MSVDTYTQFLQEPEPKDREQSIEAYLKSRLQSLDRAVAGYTSVSLTGLSGNVDLTPTQAKHRSIRLTGTPSAAVTVRIPAATGANADIIFSNVCAGSFSTVTIKSTGANAGNSSGVSLATGLTRTVRHDGESAYPVTPALSTATGQPPAARVYHNAAQSLANATQTAIAFNSERYDTAGMHDTATNNSRLTCLEDGVYLIWGSLAFAANGTGVRQAVIRLNGTTAIANLLLNNVGGSLDTAVTISTLYRLVAGDYVQLEGYQNSGGSLNVQSSANYSPEFSIVKVA